MKLFKPLVFLVVFLLLSICVLLFQTPKQAEAQAQTSTASATSKIAFPGNGNKIPCNEIAPQEFNSDRPYQASPCGDAPKALFCGNSVVIDIGTVSTGYCGSDTCECTGLKCDGKVDQLMIDLTGVQLPVLGNTQDIKNGVSSTSTIDDATRMNQYLSPYLNGTTDEAENGQTDLAKVVDFSGPIKKLLPQQIQEAQRIASVKIQSTTYSPDTGGKDTHQPVTESANHNQIVVCYNKPITLVPSWLTNLFGLNAIGLGKAAPKDCYDQQHDYTLRLKDWNDSPFDVAYKDIEGWISTYHLYPSDLVDQIVASAAVDRWPKKIPPLPWSDKEGKPFATDDAYQKAYNEWRGDICAYINLPVLGRKVVCIGIPYVTNSDYADLFPYVPLANTTDKSATQLINSVEIQSGGRATISSSDYSLQKSPTLYFAHTQETADLSALLQKTFKASGQSGATIPNDVEVNSTCQTLKSYSNPGDDASFIKPKSYLEVDNISYHVSKIQCANRHTEEKCDLTDPRTGKCLHQSTIITADCSDDIYVTIPMQNKTPNLDDIWKNTVAGSQSIFRKIYPQTGINAPVNCIADIPGTSDAIYSVEAGPKTLTRVIEPDGSSINGGDKGKGTSSINAQMYFPHLGGVEQYFLQGIQTALRPLGFGEQVTNSQFCTNIQCGELPKFPPAPASSGCGVGSTNAMVGDIPKSLKDIVAAASQTYKVPGNLILGVMYGEGLFNTDKTGKHYIRLNWTDTNVKNWATCEKVPGCNETGDDNFMGFNGNDWTNIQGKILPDLKKLDPTKKTADRCNLLDAIYGEAWNLHDSADGGMAFQCYGIDLKASIPTSCDWNPSQYESAIKIAENGYDHGCFTLPGSCATGGGNAALCPGGGDTCEHVGGAGNTSHNACIWDVAHGK